MAGESSMNMGAKGFHVDIFDRVKKMRVVAELSVINEEDIRIDLNKDFLIIFANRRERSYYKNIKLPRASKSIIGRIYNNGILEIILD